MGDIAEIYEEMAIMEELENKPIKTEKKKIKMIKKKDANITLGQVMNLLMEDENSNTFFDDFMSDDKQRRLLALKELKQGCRAVMKLQQKYKKGISDYNELYNIGVTLGQVINLLVKEYGACGMMDLMQEKQEFIDSVDKMYRRIKAFQNKKDTIYKDLEELEVSE